MSRGLRAWAPALVWAGVIFALSSRPTLAVPLGDGRDKIAHFVAYALLGALLAHARRGDSFPAGMLLLGWAYGASDEIHQSFVPGRSMELADWIADALGVLAGIVLFRTSLKMLHRRFYSSSESVRP